MLMVFVMIDMEYHCDQVRQLPQRHLMCHEREVEVEVGYHQR